MMNVQMTSNQTVALTGVAEATTSASMGEHLSAEGLLLYCQTQLNSLDGDIKELMDEQLKNLERKKVLSELRNTMNQHSPPDSNKDFAEIQKAFDKAIASLPEGDPLRAELQREKGEVSNAIGGICGMFTKEFGISKTAWKGHVGDITNMIDTVSGNAEITMIRLQSLISQRQTAVQLTTNMTAKLEKSPGQIAGNIGR